MNLILDKILHVLSYEGSLIFYTYTDILEAGSYQWVGELLPGKTGKNIKKRVDDAEVSIGVYCEDKP